MSLHYLPAVNAIAATAALMTTNARNRRAFDTVPLLCSPIILRLPAILKMRKSRGTLATPLKTAVNMSTFTGLRPLKPIRRPIAVASMMTP